MERSAGSPGRQLASRPPVAIVRLIARLDRRQVDSHHVPRIAGDQPGAFLRIDDVVRRRHDRGEVADDVRGIAKGAERLDSGHDRGS